MKKKPTKKSRAFRAKTIKRTEETQRRIKKLIRDQSPFLARLERILSPKIFVEYKTFEPAPKSVADICREINKLEGCRPFAMVLGREEELKAAIASLRWSIGIDKRTPRETFEP